MRTNHRGLFVRRMSHGCGTRLHFLLNHQVVSACFNQPAIIIQDRKQSYTCMYVCMYVWVRGASSTVQRWKSHKSTLGPWRVQLLLLLLLLLISLSLAPSQCVALSIREHGIRLNQPDESSLAVLSSVGDRTPMSSASLLQLLSIEQTTRMVPSLLAALDPHHPACHCISTVLGYMRILLRTYYLCHLLPRRDTNRRQMSADVSS